MLNTGAVDRFIENAVSCQLFRIGDMYIHRARTHIIGNMYIHRARKHIIGDMYIHRARTHVINCRRLWMAYNADLQLRPVRKWSVDRGPKYWARKHMFPMKSIFIRLRLTTLRAVAPGRGLDIRVVKDTAAKRPRSGSKRHRDSAVGHRTVHSH